MTAGLFFGYNKPYGKHKENKELSNHVSTGESAIC